MSQDVPFPAGDLSPSNPSSPSINFERYLIAGIENKATSLYLFPGSCITYRIGPKLLKVPNSTLSAPQIREVAMDIFPDALLEDRTPEGKANFLDTTRSFDFAYSIHGVARFRVHLFRQRGTLAMCIRVILQEIKDLNSYGPPPELIQLLDRTRGGLFVVHGKARSGKSSLLAAIVDYINRNQSRLIVILEPIIQFSHKNQYSLITQREIGIDMNTLEDGVREALRQDQDIIILDELTDTATFSRAMEAILKGITVFIATGTPDPSKTLEHLLNLKSRDDQVELIGDLMSHLRCMLGMRVEVSSSGQRQFKLQFTSAELLHSTLLSRRRELQQKSSQGMMEELGRDSSVDQSWFDTD